MLPPAKDDLVRRRWIWQALSDLFLDDEITDDTLRYIARIVAECDYTAGELDLIYRREVAPAVAFNLMDMAGGAWGYFDTVWLENRILRSWGPFRWLDRWVFAPLTIRLLRHEWIRLREFFEEQQVKVREEQEKRGGEWKPCWAKEAECYRWE